MKKRCNSAVPATRHSNKAASFPLRPRSTTQTKNADDWLQEDSFIINDNDDTEDSGHAFFDVSAGDERAMTNSVQARWPSQHKSRPRSAPTASRTVNSTNEWARETLRRLRLE